MVYSTASPKHSALVSQPEEQNQFGQIASQIETQLHPVIPPDSKTINQPEHYYL